MVPMVGCLPMRRSNRILNFSVDRPTTPAAECPLTLDEWSLCHVMSKTRTSSRHRIRIANERGIVQPFLSFVRDRSGDNVRSSKISTAKVTKCHSCTKCVLQLHKQLHKVSCPNCHNITAQRLHKASQLAKSQQQPKATLPSEKYAERVRRCRNSAEFQNSHTSFDVRC